MRLRVEYDMQLDDRGYSVMYTTTHTAYEGEDTVMSFGEASREAIGRAIGCKLHLGGFVVEEATLKKERPGSHRMHMDCSLSLSLLLEESAFRHVARGGEMDGLRLFAAEIGVVVAISLSEEIDANVVAWRWARLSYREDAA